MLNITDNKIKHKIKQDDYTSFLLVRDFRARRVLTKTLLVTFSVFILVLFLPWTQNIRSQGYITTLKPDQRPQTINSIIAGRIENWYVREGDLVEKGDTILFLSEVKPDYMDPNLLERTEQQIKAKEAAVNSYMEKVKSLDNQIDALLNTKKLKLSQASNYIQQAILSVQSDSINLEAAKTNENIAKVQYERMKELYDQGLKSLTDLERRKMKYQEAIAKKIEYKNKYLASQNKLINAEVEYGSVENQYRDKISKAESDKFTALSAMYDAEALVTKMQNMYSNYSVRSGYYYITAPQTGYITKSIKAGLGETVKEGEELVSIMPAKYDLAVSMYVAPIDLPLINLGEEVRFRFDGWPAVVFSGWPNVSHGTYGGKVVAIDRFISKNGKYRILVAPDPDEYDWPKGLRVGSGADGMALLNDVPIWYELWRRLNGFPPDYYNPNGANAEESMFKGDSKK